MKKLLSILALGTLALTLASCSDDSSKDTTDPTDTTDPKPEVTNGFELALVTDVGTIDDKSFNQGSWEGLESYAKEHNITSKYFQPTGQSTQEYESSIDLAVEGGAKVIVLPGFYFEVPAYDAQTKYPDVSFVLVDGVPNDGNGNFKVGNNVVSIKYEEAVSGFLAGYAAVADGYTKLGFIGGAAVPAVKSFGIGYIQGAEAAATELGIDNVEIKYNYFGAFNPSPEAKTFASSWYNEGTEVIFACAGGLSTSVIAAAEETEAKMVIGVDVDQSSQSSKNRVLTSAKKELTSSVYDAIESYYNNTFAGGQELVLGIEENGVGIEMKNSNFKTFDDAQYEALKGKILDGTFKINHDSEVEPESLVKNIKLNIV